MNIELKEFDLARKRIAPIIKSTNLSYSSTFSSMSDAEVYLKCENLQKTGSFKIRGASNKIAKLVEEGNLNPVVASSAGNHAQGVAYAATRFGIASTIVMPKAAPLAKVSATEGYGAKVVLCGDCYDDAYAEAKRICEEENATFLHPYNDPDVMAGQGTLGMEILRQLPDADIVLVPVGGGGLLAGVSAALKQLNPRVKVYGVQAEGANAAVQSFRSGKLTFTDSTSTIADGIAVKQPGDLTFDIIKQYADGIVDVSDDEIAQAILLLLERAKLMVEPAGATTLAAVLNQKIDARGKKVVPVLSGGNIDVSLISSIISLGLVARHRWIHFTVKLLDRPGSLVSLLNIIAANGANVMSIQHDRMETGLKPNETYVHVSCEVNGEEHEKQLMNSISENGFKIGE